MSLDPCRFENGRPDHPELAEDARSAGVPVSRGWSAVPIVANEAELVDAMGKQTDVSAVLDVIDQTPGAEVINIGGKKHAKIRWRWRDDPRMIVVSRTPSDRRSRRNAVAGVRRQMRDQQ